MADYSIWPWKVIIPSYSRSTYIITHTLQLCKKYSVPQEIIYIFVATNQREEYENTLKENEFQNVQIITGPVGLKNMRNFITDYFDEGTPMLCMDDDISELYMLEEDESVSNINTAARWKLRSLRADDFYTFTTYAYNEMRKHKRDLFGIYPVKNGFFMKDLPAITYNARFCVGAFWGIINCKIKLTLEEKEDMERSILFTIKDNGVLRLNNITLATKYYKMVGGMQAHLTHEDRVKNSIESAHALVAKYPNICKLYNGKKNGICEVRFKVQ